jgi:hypothetical protein
MNRLEVVKRDRAFAIRALREAGEEYLVASAIGVLFERMPGETRKVILELAEIIRANERPRRSS